MCNIHLRKVRSEIIVCKYNDWLHIAPRINDNTSFEIEELNINTLMDIDKDLISTIINHIKHSKERSFFTYNIQTKAFQKRLILEYPQSSEEKETLEQINNYKHHNNIKFVTKSNFRIYDMNQIINNLEPYLKALIDPIFGVFKGHYRGVSDVMPIISVDSQLKRRTYDAYGRAETYEKAYYTAILEGLEREHGVAPSTKCLLNDSEESLKINKYNFASLNKFIHYTDQNYSNLFFEHEKYETNQNINWRYAYAHHLKKEILIPEQILYFSNEQFYDEYIEERYVSDSSNGTAIGSTFDEATLAALFELVERDSFMVHWFTKSSPKRVKNLEDLDNDNIQKMYAYLKSFGYKIHLFDITLESQIPSFWLLIENIDENNEKNLAFYTAAGANINPIKAIEAAFVEASTSIKVFKKYMYSKYSKDRLNELTENFDEVKMLEDHLYLYSSKKMKKYLEFALHTPFSVDINEILTAFNKNNHIKYLQKELVNELLNNISNYHPEIYIGNLTSKYLQSLMLNCVKLVIPSMQNIAFGQQYQNINQQRLKQAVEINNLNGSTIDFNRVPHPFP